MWISLSHPIVKTIMEKCQEAKFFMLFLKQFTLNQTNIWALLTKNFGLRESNKCGFFPLTIQLCDSSSLFIGILIDAIYIVIKPLHSLGILTNLVCQTTRGSLTHGKVLLRKQQLYANCQSLTVWAQRETGQQPTAQEIASDNVICSMHPFHVRFLFCPHPLPLDHL